ncbi:MAG TPA: SDR family oxidoreductase [Rhodocyclaceae bacterium]|nr:SDR family oxidoreductase [Rhodocyclaceae bacterium]
MTAPLRVFITGASGGIGEALAHRYALQGANVGLVARRAERLDAIVVRLTGGAANHAAYVADVTDHEAMRVAAQQYIVRFGLPDIVIANAGISVGTLATATDDIQAFEAVLRTNLLGVMVTFLPFVNLMRSRGSGRLVGISSVAGVRGLPGAAAYCASKAGISRYLESMRVELHGTGVKVVEIRPGYIATPMTAVNPYRMPFILQADEAARRFVRAIETGSSRATIPWQMAIVAKVLALMPNWLYDLMFSHAKRKPRGLPL